MNSINNIKKMFKNSVSTNSLYENDMFSDHFSVVHEIALEHVEVTSQDRYVFKV